METGSPSGHTHQNRVLRLAKQVSELSRFVVFQQECTLRSTGPHVWRDCRPRRTVPSGPMRRLEARAPSTGRLVRHSFLICNTDKLLPFTHCASAGVTLAAIVIIERHRRLATARRVTLCSAAGRLRVSNPRSSSQSIFAEHGTNLSSLSIVSIYRQSFTLIVLDKTVRELSEDARGL